MAESRNNKVIWGLLILTLIAAAWVSVAEESATVALTKASTPVVSMEHSHPSITESRTGKSQLTLRVTKRVPIVGEPANLFSMDKPVDPHSQGEQAPPAIEVPALPYSYAGKLVDEDNLIVFLMRGNRNHAVTVGDVVDRVWKLDAIEPNRLLFSHIPTQTAVPLLIGDRS